MNQEKQKLIFRKIIKKALRGLSISEKEKLDNRIFQKLLGLDVWKRARVLLIYLSTELEINTESIIDQAFMDKKKVAVPVLVKGNMEFRFITANSSLVERGPYKIKEPDLSSPLFNLSPKGDEPLLVIVPGLAFDLQMQRLGRGGGYYDRWLQDLALYQRPLVFSLALCYDRQILDSVPVESHDHKVDGLLSESNFYTWTK